MCARHVQFLLTRGNKQTRHHLLFFLNKCHSKRVKWQMLDCTASWDILFHILTTPPFPFQSCVIWPILLPPTSNSLPSTRQRLCWKQIGSPVIMTAAFVMQRLNSAWKFILVSVEAFLSLPLCPCLKPTLDCTVVPTYPVFRADHES